MAKNLEMTAGNLLLAERQCGIGNAKINEENEMKDLQRLKKTIKGHPSQCSLGSKPHPPNLQAERKQFTFSDLLADVLNIIHLNSRGISINREDVLDSYHLSKSSYYRFLDFLKTLEFVEIIFSDSSEKTIRLKAKFGVQK